MVIENIHMYAKIDALIKLFLEKGFLSFEHITPQVNLKKTTKYILDGKIVKIRHNYYYIQRKIRKIRILVKIKSKLIIYVSDSQQFRKKLKEIENFSFIEPRLFIITFDNLFIYNNKTSQIL
ncbi:hypothetical protein AK88_02940 [Plasmodium fragile]|uniref:Uncharacterized protein n=1 Tax=Plasmodium fragile TaxID=5857 RepID=A0A0D9QK96_PLAFR|nr:uncharacterized protein AK88_02940 [Plasmodium fragile]KJP87383.1 hypothetical protein AK88_02940 [Plasmodium fragile]